MKYSMKGWSVFYRSATGEGTVTATTTGAEYSGEVRSVRGLAVNSPESAHRPRITLPSRKAS
jgi:hypothetical protein